MISVLIGLVFVVVSGIASYLLVRNREEYWKRQAEELKKTIRTMQREEFDRKIKVHRIDGVDLVQAELDSARWFG